MADQNDISDLEKEYEAKINAVVANEAYKASVEDTPDSDAKLGGTIDISNLLSASNILGKITDSIKSLKNKVKPDTPNKSSVSYETDMNGNRVFKAADYYPTPEHLARPSRKDKAETEEFLQKYGDEIRAVHLKRQNAKLEQFLDTGNSELLYKAESLRKQQEAKLEEIFNTGTSGLLYRAESINAEEARVLKYKEQMELFSKKYEYREKNREKGNIKEYQKQLDTNSGVNFTLPNTDLRNLIGNSQAATRIKNEDANRETKRDFYIQQDARRFCEEIIRASSQILITDDAGKSKIAQEKFISGNYIPESVRHFQFLNQGMQNNKPVQDENRKDLKDSSIKEKIISALSVAAEQLKKVSSVAWEKAKEKTGPVWEKVKESSKNYGRYERVNWGRFGGSTSRNFKDWKQNVINRSNAANMYDGTFRGLVNSTGLNFAKSLTRTFFPFGKADKVIPLLGVGAELLKKGAQKLYEAGVEGLKAFGEIQAIQTNLGVVYGNQSEADQMFDKLSSYAVKSPFSTSQIANFAVLLKQSGVYSSDVEDTLKMLGDTAGGNEEKMNRIANNYAQIVAMGKATSMDLRQFANANIPIYEELKKQLGNISQKELRQITAQGGITSDIIEKAFMNMTSEGGRFANATEKGAQTYKARKTNLADIKQLGMAEFGELVYNISPTQMLMDLQEQWYSSLKNGSKFFNNKLDLWQVNKSYENYDTITKLYDALKSQTEATDSNTEALSENSLKRLKTDSDSSYRAYIDKARANGASLYLSKSEPAREKLQKKDYALDILNNIDQKQFNEMFNSPFLQGLLRDMDVLYTPIEDFNKESIVNYIQNVVTKRITTELDKAKNANEGKNYDRYLQSQGISLARDASEEFGRFSKDKNSSTTIDAEIYEMYKQTDAFNEEEQKKKQDRLKEARKLLESQKKLGMNENDFSWIKNNQDMDATEIVGYLKRFYGYNYLDTASENLTDETKNIISGNLSNIGSKLESMFTGADQQIIIELNKELEQALNEKPNSVAARNQNNESINRIAGKYKEFAENLKDDTQKTLLNALFIDPKSTLIDEKQLDEAEKNSKKKVDKVFTPFWKRYAASILNVSVEGLSTQNVYTQLKNENAREMNQSIANAMLSSGFSPEEALKMVSYKTPEIRTGGISGSRGVDQETTSKAYENFAMSSEATAKVTESYLQKLQQQESQLAQFFSGAAFQREDLDKLYDSEWASAMGYTNKESWVNAFDAMTDASGKFTEATLKSVSAIYTEVKKRRENASILSGFKSENETLDDKLRAEKSRSFINNLYYPDSEQFQKFNALPKTDKEAYLNTLQKIYTENGTKDIDRVQKDVSGFFTGTMLDGNENVVTAKKNLAEANKNLQEAKENLSKTKGLLDSTPEYVTVETPSNSKNPITKVKERLFGGKTEQVVNPAYTEAKVNFDSAQAEVNAAQVVVNSAKTDLEKEIQSASGIDSEVYKEQNSYIDKVGEYNQLQKTESLKEMSGWKELSKQGEWSEYDNPLFSFFHPDIEVAQGNTYRQQEILNAYGAEQGTNFRDYVKARYTTENPDGTLSAGDENTQTYNNLMEAKEQLESMGTAGQELAASLDFSNLDISSLEKMEEMLGGSSKASKNLKDTMKGAFSSIKESAKSSALSAIQNSWTAIGESIANSENATEGIAAAWRDAAKQLLSSISATLTKAGLELVISGAQEHDKGTILAGLAMAAAGGIAGISAGMLGSSSSSSDSSEENQYEERIKNLKDALSDLIDQAKTDAEYYQKNLLHKQALSENDYYSSRSISVNDAIITPSGNVISTAPDDYLIATKTPDTLVNNSNIQGTPEALQIEFNPTFNFIDQTNQGVTAEVEEKQDEDGNVSFDIVLKNIVGESIANGDFDNAFNAREYRLRGKSLAW